MFASGVSTFDRLFVVGGTGSSAGVGSRRHDRHRHHSLGGLGYSLLQIPVGCDGLGLGIELNTLQQQHKKQLVIIGEITIIIIILTLKINNYKNEKHT